MNKKIFSFISFLIFFISVAQSETTINLSDYDYPTPTEEKDSLYNIVIMGTNDIHGAYFPQTIQIPGTEKSYKSGGLQYLGNYINIMRETWKDRFFWLDAGDQFQGGLETKISKGELMTEFYNKMKLNGATIGNHEWDYGQEYLFNRSEHSKFPYIVANVKKDGISPFMKNQVSYQIFQVGKIKLGVIGLTTLETLTTTSGDLEGITFQNYQNVVREMIKIIKGQCDAIALLVHFGTECPNHSKDEKYKIGMRDKNTKMPECYTNNELSLFLKGIEKDSIDIVISGHTHEIVHQWINDIPVISSQNNGKYTNLIYLTFSKNAEGKYTLLKDQIKMEGPLPVCEKVFMNIKRCDSMSSSEIQEAGDLVNYMFHEKEVIAEPELEELTNLWWSKYEEYVKSVITKTDNLLSQSFDKEEALGNIYSDFFRRRTGAEISILNPGSFRTTWNIGNITKADIYNMSPFENSITSFQMMGAELRRMLFEIQSGSCAFYPTSGLKQIVQMKPKKLIEVKLFDGVTEEEIQDQVIYTIATNSFLIPFGGDDFAKVLKWYEKSNVKVYGIFTEQLIEYLQEITEIEVSKFVDKYNPRLRIQIKSNLRKEIS